MTVRILVGDCREKLREIPSGSINCCVTSPPYFGLRDYGTGSWVGGDASCSHVVGEMRGGLGLENSAANTRGGAKKIAQTSDIKAKDDCPHCGAHRIDKQIGLERTPEEFVLELVSVFREVRRVLREDGTVWLNLGDSYANHGKWGGHTGGKHARSLHSSPIGRNKRYSGLKPKDLIGIPWMVAFAMRADGWYLRQDIVWSKPNPMPESVRDRCTKAHEYVFLLSKSEKYFYDADAIAEPIAKGAAGSVFHEGKTATHQSGRASTAERQQRETRNKRDVWTVASAPYAEAHFATFPPALIEPCILAGSLRGGVILDPFGGAGTTAIVADRLGRDAVLCELNPEYAEMANHRILRETYQINSPVQTGSHQRSLADLMTGAAE